MLLMTMLIMNDVGTHRRQLCRVGGSTRGFIMKGGGTTCVPELQSIPHQSSPQPPHSGFFNQV